MMKNMLRIGAIVMMLITGVMVCGCGKGKEDENVDYSAYEFTDVKWTRDTEEDIEYIRFGADGSFSYYCACGNPVNDADVCEGYTYDDSTKTITLNCLEELDSMITQIIVNKCDGNVLELDFDGEIREFVKEE